MLEIDLTARPFQRLPDESLFEYGLKIWRLFRGAPHHRLARALLYAGFGLLSTPLWWPLLLAIVQYLGLLPLDVESSKTLDNYAAIGGLFCLALVPIVFFSGEWLRRPEEVNTNLPLTLPEAPGVEGIAAVRYQAAVVPFFGRDTELATLQAFVDEEVAVRWLAVGGPGATGKSRLAMELCRRLRVQGWHAGFWTSDLHGDLTNWRPQTHHFVVMDYVLGQEKQAAALINRAHVLANEGRPHKFRGLLIDRDALAVSEGVATQRTIGPTLRSLESAYSPFQLKPLDARAVQHAIDELGERKGLTPDQIASVQRIIDGIDPARRLVLGTMLCLFADSLSAGEVSFVEVVRELLQQETSRWSEFEFDASAKLYLQLATVSGGIRLDNLSRITPPAQAFLQSFNQGTAYERVVGESAAHYLAPLSHDLVGELYVLDALIPAAPDDRELIDELTRLGLGVNGGQGLVAFFTRAANDYPEHPALALLVTPFSNRESAFLVWLLIMANVIDKIPIPVEDKISAFQRAAIGIVSLPRPQPNLLIVLQGYFLRLLANLTAHHELNEFVGEYRVASVATERPPVPTASNDRLHPVIGPPIEVLPEDYCRTIIEALDLVPVSDRSRLANPHLLDVYTHALLWAVAGGTLDPVRIRALVDSAMHIFDDRWMPALSRTLTNTIAAIINFDHARRRANESIEVVNHILSALSNRNHFDETAHCYSAASAALRLSRVDLPTIQQLVRTFDAQFSWTQIESSLTVASARIGLSVAVMYGFRTNSDYREAHDLARDASGLCSKYPSPDNIENTSLALGQLLRYQGNLSSDSEKVEVLGWVLNHAISFGTQNLKVAERVMQELSTRNSSTDTSAAIRVRLYNDAKALATSFANQPFDGSLYMGGFIHKQVVSGLEKNDKSALDSLADDVRQLQELGYVEFEHASWSSITTEFFRCWNEAKRDQDLERMRLVGEVSEKWLQTADLSGVSGILEHIVKEYRRE